MADEQPVHPPATKPSSSDRPRPAAIRPSSSGTNGSGITPVNSPAAIPASLRAPGSPPVAGPLLTAREVDQGDPDLSSPPIDQPELNEVTISLPIIGPGLDSSRGATHAAGSADEPTTDLSGVLEAAEVSRAAEVTDLSDPVRAGESRTQRGRGGVQRDRGPTGGSHPVGADRGLPDQDTHDLGRLRVGGYLPAGTDSAASTKSAASTRSGVRATGGRVPSSRVSSPGDSRGRRGRPGTHAAGGVSRPPSLGLQFQPVVRVVDMASSVTFFELLGAEIIHGERTAAYVLMQLGTIQIRLDRHDLADREPAEPERHQDGRGRAKGRHGNVSHQGRAQVVSRLDSRKPRPGDGARQDRAQVNRLDSRMARFGEDLVAPRQRGEFELSFVTAVPLGELERRLRSASVTIAEGVHHTDFGAQLHVRTPDGLLIKFGQLEPDGWT